MESGYHDWFRPVTVCHLELQGHTTTHKSQGCIDRRKVGWGVDIGETVDKVDHRMTFRNSGPVLRIWNHCHFAQLGSNCSSPHENFQGILVIFCLMKGLNSCFSSKAFFIILKESSAFFVCLF